MKKIINKKQKNDIIFSKREALRIAKEAFDDEFLKKEMKILAKR
ncbi:hypothetical protein [Candidatus Mycoplasma mahonii]|nr:hypothetical protein [Candidatus Mycoplasma mahonii]WKX02279.1 hypothetical protein O3I44_02645 [Candidatus Mycoplasma mahonii]